MSQPRAPCECELPGDFYTGVPGILAAMENGRLAPGAVVERCDLCERYPSDVAAAAKLHELGLAASAECPTFDLHLYAVVQVEFPGIVASCPQEASQWVLDRFDWDLHGRNARLVDNAGRMALLADAELDDRRFELVLEEVEP